MAMSSEQRRRAATYVLRALGELGRDPAWLVLTARVDRQTVTDFLDGARWPQSQTRNRIEAAIGKADGTLELVALGALGGDESEVDDPVEVAIRNSNLTRANQNKLVGTYYEMLDSQEERGTA